LAGSSNLESPVQKKIDKLITYIVVAIVFFAVIFLALSLARGQEFSETLRFMLALIVSSVPEGLPIALSVILVLGMQRMAKKNALVRSMTAIENIGLLTMIASDKTGTLTKNQLKVQDVWEDKPNSDLHDLAVSVYKSIAQTESGKLFDPLDEAFKEFAAEYKVEISEKDKMVQALPFDQKFSMSGAVWQTKPNKLYDVYIKGAPEKVIQASKLAKKRSRHCRTRAAPPNWARFTGYCNCQRPISPRCYKYRRGFAPQIDFLALIAVADELREEAAEAVNTARRAGVNVVMITGDHAETAFAIGKKIGLAEHRDEVFDSRILDEHKDHETLAHHIHNAKVFARVTPENKFKILTILKKKHITAMTGDGVNDVPALAQAHIGIAMGSGTQIAKESGDIVLLDNNFSSIVEALKEGRVIFANIRRMLYYLLSTNFGIVLTIILSLLAGLPLPLVAVQILWINLVTDTGTGYSAWFRAGRRRCNE
jgi:P-type Ca2+ transporter type 2C